MLNEAFLHQKQQSLILRKEPLSTRFEHLDSLEKMIRDNTDQIIAALQKDFSKPPAETLLTEVATAPFLCRGLFSEPGTNPRHKKGAVATTDPLYSNCENALVSRDLLGGRFQQDG